MESNREKRGVSSALRRGKEWVWSVYMSDAVKWFGNVVKAVLSPGSIATTRIGSCRVVRALDLHRHRVRAGQGLNEAGDDMRVWSCESK